MTAPYIIAEAAQGYEGDPSLALFLVKAAAAAKADAIKFQIVFADDLAVPDYPYYGLFADLEMTTDEWRGIRQAAADAGLEFIGDVFGPQSLALARDIGLDGAKIHTTCFYDTAFVREVAEAWDRVYLSIGGVPTPDIEALFADAFPGGRNVTVLYGYQSEPTPLEKNNLLRIPELRRTLGCDIGFMDHSDGDGAETVTLSAMALALGVTVFEKHITLDRALELEDYVSALAPGDFAEYVRALHDLHAALGSSDLNITEDELSYGGRALKRVVAAAALPAGHTLRADDLAMARSADGTGAFRPEDVIGRTLKFEKAAYASIDAADLVDGKPS